MKEERERERRSRNDDAMGPSTAREATSDEDVEIDGSDEDGDPLVGAGPRKGKRAKGDLRGQGESTRGGKGAAKTA